MVNSKGYKQAIKLIQQWQEKGDEYSWLNLRGLSLTKLPNKIGQLTNLRNLNIENNQLISFPNEISCLKELRHLIVDNNCFSQFPLEIVELSNLESIYFNNNQIISIPKEISRLVNLQYLALRNNFLKSLPNEIGNLKNLRSLLFNNNFISELPDEIGQLENLTHFNIANNQLKSLPSNINGLKKLTHIDLSGNTGLEERLHKSIISESDDAQRITNFYVNIEEGKERPLNEAKIVVVGEADVGKSLLVRRLVYGDFENTNSTSGINIETFVFENIRLNIWDFGGQEVMHSTHQFFFTERTLYILVVNARQNEDKNQTVEWLQRIKSFGGDSPIIIVGSHVDKNDRNIWQQGQGYFFISRRDLTEQFENIKGFYGVCSDARKSEYDNLFDAFKNGLFREIMNLKDIDRPFPSVWFSVKEELESMSENDIPYISNHDYFVKCLEKGIYDEQSKDSIREILNQLGIIIYFNDLPDKMIFNPAWVTKGVYSLIDNLDIIKNKGEVEVSQIINIFAEIGYEPDDYKYILGVMKKFKLCVELIKDKTFLLPDLLLNVDEPDDIGDWNDSINFQYHYEIYLKNIFTQFIVRTYSIKHQRMLWRNGLILVYEDTQALIKFYASDKKIIIRVKGRNIKKRQNLLAVIRREFYEIHREFANLSFRQLVGYPAPLFDNNGNEIEALKDYEELIQMEEDIPTDSDGEIFTYVKELRYSLPISHWLDGIESRSERKRKQKVGEIVMANVFNNNFFGGSHNIPQASSNVEINQNKIDPQELEGIVNEILNKVNENQRVAMEKLADEVLAKMAKSATTHEEKQTAEDTMKGKWETKIKYVFGVIPVLETSRTVTANEFISVVQRWLYRDSSKPISIVETSETDDDSILKLKDKNSLLLNKPY